MFPERFFLSFCQANHEFYRNNRYRDAQNDEYSDLSLVPLVPNNRTFFGNYSVIYLEVRKIVVTLHKNNVIMASNIYTENKLIQALACLCGEFTKMDIINLSAKVGMKLKSSKPFLEEFMGKTIIVENEKNYGVNTFSIVPWLWEDIIRAIEPELIERMAEIVKKEVKDSRPEFALAAYRFFHGQDFVAAVNSSAKPRSSSQKNNYTAELVIRLAESKDNFPLLKELGKSYLVGLFDRISTRFMSQTFDDNDILIAKEVLLKNESFAKSEREWLSSSIAFYNDFVRHADISKAREGCIAGTDYRVCIDAFMQLQKGDYDASFKTFVAGLKGSNERHYEDSVINFYYGVALAYSTMSSAQTKIRMLFKDYDFGYNDTLPMKMMLLIGKGQKEDIDMKSYWTRCSSLTDRAFAALLCKHYKISNRIDFDNIQDKIEEQDLRLLQVELSADFDRFKETERNGLHPTLQKYTEKEKWEVKLEELLKLNGGNTTAEAKPKTNGGQRIVYEVNTTNFYIQPKLQKSKDGVNWTAGRNISLEKMMKGTAEGMTDTDRPIASCIKAYSYGWYGGVTYEFEGNKAMAALVGHPYVFDSKTGAHLDVVSEKPQLSVKLKNGEYRVTANIDPKDCSGGVCVKAEGSEIKVVRLTTKMRQTIETLNGLTFPEEAKERLTALLKLLSGETVVMGDLLKNSEDITTRQAHAETIVRLQPAGETIRCQLIVRPFGKVPPICTPGKGMQRITTTIDGKQVQTKRNLKKEKENYEQIKALMVDFEDDSYEDNVWNLYPDECLLLLEQLQEKKDCSKIEWPEGEKLKVARGILMPKDFKIKINRAANWFEISGDVQISNDKKMKIAELMEKISQSKGNFIQLSDNEYVRLTAELRRHIELLERIATTNRGKMRVSQFNAPMLEDLAHSGIAFDSDKAFNDLMERINRSNTTEIKIPKTINADLRSYQKEGFLWMSRLALWGAGALLADDMGLGKTLQAITLMLSRAAQGPQLVVVPTSVVMNWSNELLRFAPSLNVKILNTLGDERNAMIRDAKEFDIVITTYGLLSNEEGSLTSRTWNTIVLDEAHTIKNRETKMSQSAMKLKADFRLLLTGTPLQNHVSEMWNLMQFANPDLLGSYTDFTSRFLLPIERDHDKERQRQLKRIITPFILRRTKSEVLNELPEKTEITLKIELSQDEWAFYDNIRQKALAEMENHEATAMQALTEITRLRQAACNVRLVEKELDIPSSKLESFIQLVDELHTNHHRALVFSQFTSHLALVRERLDKEGISYLYLDGSTTAKERLRLVSEFQHGDMPLFLISLKAGGLGLNLTAADYVVHLDPWWNPAIEDQASDRAYRIGQHKPVTIYRLIASGTIEDKIIELHKTKKNMADALLEGGNISASLSREEMVELLKTAR